MSLFVVLLIFSGCTFAEMKEWDAKYDEQQKYYETIQKSIETREYFIGWTGQQIIQKFGKPHEVRTSYGPGYVFEFWNYYTRFEESRIHITVKNGIVEGVDY